jgi:hypothetical protein
MSDTLEGTPAVSVAPVLPNTPAPGAGEVSESSVDVETIVNKVVDRLFPEFDKRYQSTKDKRFAEMQKTLSDLQKEFAGQVTQPAQTEPAKAEPAPTQVAQPVQVTQPQAGTQKVVTEVEKTILTGLGLSADDVAVTSVVGNFEERMTQYAQIAERRKQPANPAAVMAQSGGAPVTNEQLAKELMQLQEANPFATTERIKQLKQQLGM